MQYYDKNNKHKKGENMKKDLEIYVHIPFCARKCRYCDFLSFLAEKRDTAPICEKDGGRDSAFS